MKFIYLILCHNNPAFLHRLVHALDMEENYFLIHLDAKTPIEPFLKAFKRACNGHVFFIPKRKTVTWGSFSMVEATVELIRFCFQLGLEADYFHLISGQDYPIQSNEKIRDFFKSNNSKSFIQHFAFPIKNLQGKGKIRLPDKYWLHWENNTPFNNPGHKTNQYASKELPDGIHPYGGIQWWSLHAGCIRYLFEQCTDENDLYQYYQNTKIPDEMFFHTLIMNSPFKDTIVNDNLRYIQWEKGNPHPNTLTMHHWDSLVSCGKLFARKFDPLADSEILDRIDKYHNSA